MHRQRRVLELAAVPDEDELPLQIIAFRTPEGVVFETKEHHVLVSGHRYQRHISIACHTEHRTHQPFTNINLYRGRCTGAHYNHECH